MPTSASILRKDVEEVPVNFLDIETNWPWTGRQRIVEVWIGKYKYGRLQYDFPRELRLINPECGISTRATDLHGISERMVRDCPTFDEIADSLIRFIGDDFVVAHNGFRFDFPVIRNELRRCGFHVPRMRTLDTLLIAQRQFSFRNNRLDHLARIMKLNVNGHHRAKVDGVLTAGIFHKMTHRIRKRDNLETLTLQELEDMCFWRFAMP